MDLGDMSWLAEHNEGRRYFLLAVNPFSKKFYVVPLRGKGAREVADATKKILQLSRIRYQNMCTDKGTEFKNVIFRREIEQANNIKHFYSSGVKKVRRWG